MRLADIVGQDLAVGALRRAIAAARVPHAYLFEGPTGVGKHATAIGLALALDCPEKPGEGCGLCGDCQRIDAGVHPDVVIVTPATAQILIEQVREVVALAARRPHEAPARVIVICEAERLNANAANSLLKSLEEPAPGNHFVLTSAAPERLLSTIRSRTQRLRFLPVAEAKIRDVLVACGVDPERAALAATDAGGSVGRAVEISSADGESDVWPRAESLLEAAHDQTMATLFSAAAGVADKEAKEALPHVLAAMARVYREALATAAGASDHLSPVAARRHFIERAARAGLPATRSALQAVASAREAIEANVNATLAVETMLLDLRRALA